MEDNENLASSASHSSGDSSGEAGANNVPDQDQQGPEEGRMAATEEDSALCTEKHKTYQTALNKYNTAVRDFWALAKASSPALDSLATARDAVNDTLSRLKLDSAAFLSTALPFKNQANRVSRLRLAGKNHEIKRVEVEECFSDMKESIEMLEDEATTERTIAEAKVALQANTSVINAEMSQRIQDLATKYDTHRTQLEALCVDDGPEDQAGKISHIRSKMEQLRAGEQSRDDYATQWLASCVAGDPEYYLEVVRHTASDKQFFQGWINWCRDQLEKLSATTTPKRKEAPGRPPMASSPFPNIDFTRPPPRVRFSNIPRNSEQFFANTFSTSVNSNTMDVTAIVSNRSKIELIAGSRKTVGTIVERMMGQPELLYVDSRYARGKKPPTHLPQVDGSDVIAFKDFLKLFEFKVHKNNKYDWDEKYFELIQNLRGAAYALAKLHNPDKDGYLQTLQELEERYASLNAHKGALWAKLNGIDIDHRKLKTVHVAKFTAMEILANVSRSCYQEVGCMIVSGLTMRMCQASTDHWNLFLLAHNYDPRDPTIDNFCEWCSYLEMNLAKDTLAKAQHDASPLKNVFAAPAATKVLATDSTVEFDKEEDEHWELPGESEDEDESELPVFAVVDDDGKFKGCALCDAENYTAKHHLSNCRIFKNLSRGEQRSVMNRSKACWKCYEYQHFARDCKINVKCATCNKPHPTFLHRYSKVSLLAAISNESIPRKKTTLFRVIPVEVANNPEFRGAIKVNASCDDHAGVSFVQESLAKSIHAKLRPQTQVLKYLTRSEVLNNYRATFFLRAVDHSVATKITANTTLNICGSVKPPDIKSLKTEYDHLARIPFEVYADGPCQILLGLDQARLMTAVEPDVVGPENTPVARKLPLGWTVVHGKSPDETALAVEQLDDLRSLEDAIQKILDYEIDPWLSNKRCITLEDKKAEDIVKSFLFQKDNHYGTGVPWRNHPEPPNLPNNYEQVLKWQTRHEAELNKNDVIWQQYMANFNEWISEGYIRKVGPTDRSGYFIPCFGVFRKDSTTMKLRVVTDCKRKFGSDRKSINDEILTGPKLQNDVREVLLQFRRGPFAFTSDIARMYLQFLLREEDMKYHRIIYRGEAFEFTRWPFGNVAAPFATLFCLNSHFKNLGKDNLIKTVQQSLYMDDLMPSGFDEDGLVALFTDLRQACKEAGLELRKVVTNSSRLIKSIDQSLLGLQLDIKSDDDMLDGASKALGCKWIPATDLMGYKNVEILPAHQKFTKRNLFRVNGLCFDPIGYLEPVTLKGRLLLQDVCHREDKPDWDDVIVDEALEEEWKNYLSELAAVSSIEFPRAIFQNANEESTLHVFCDASKRMYSCVLYLVQATCSGSNTSSFVTCRRKLCKKGSAAFHKRS